MMEVGGATVRVTADTTEFDKLLQRTRDETDAFDKRATRSMRSVRRETAKLGKEGAKDMRRFRDASKGVDAAIAGLPGRLGSIVRQMQSVSRAGGIGSAALLGTAGAFTALTLAVGASLREAEKFRRSELRTQAVLKATGNASGFTAKEIRAMSRSIARDTLASAEGMEAAAQKLLTFRSVQGDVFERAMVLFTDLAEVGLGSLDSAAVQLGKALEDPVAGLSALARVGVSFSQAQKDTIKELVESNRLLEAQGMILEALESQLGGVGGAAAGGLTGAVDNLGQSWSELMQALGEGTGLLEGLRRASIGFAHSMDLIADAVVTTEMEALEEELAAVDTKLARLEESLRRASGTSFAELVTQKEIDRLRQSRQAILDRVDALNAQEEAERTAARAAAEAAQIEIQRGRAEAQMAEFMADAREMLADAREREAADAKASADARAAAIRALENEAAVLAEVQRLVDADGLSRKQAAIEEQIRIQQINQGVSALSAEGQAIETAIRNRERMRAAMEAEFSAQEKLDAARQAFADRIAGVQEQIVALETEAVALTMSAEAAEAYRIEQELINAAIKEFGALTPEQRAQIEQVSEAYGRASGRVEDLRGAQDRLGESASSAQKSFAQDFGGAIDQTLSGLISKTEDAKSAVLKLALAFIEAAVQAALLNQTQQAGAGGATAGGGGLGGALASIGSGVLASILHDGGTVGRDGTPRVAPAQLFINAPRYHDGLRLRPDEHAAILQKGEQVIPRGQTAGNTVNQTFNIKTPDPNAFKASQRQIARKSRAALGV